MQPVTSVGSRIARLAASFFYVGFVPIIPGTFGSLAAFALYFPLLYLNLWPVYLGVVVAVSALGVWAATRAEKDSRIVDPGFVVIDEVAGQLITLFLVPFSWLHVVVGFVLFRILDILKPFPARRAENLHGGLGIMADDIIVGVYGCLLLHLTLYLFPSL